MNAGDSMSSGNHGLRDASGSFPMKQQGALVGSGTQGDSGEGSAKWNDPWSLYGGNIAAACRATNEAVVHERQEEADDDKEKQRQRASNRLTAWQSRERKRIEFEVMQERKVELTRKNAELTKENTQMRLLIRRIKALNDSGNGCMGVAVSQVTALQGSAAAASIPRLDTPAGYFYPFTGTHPNNELPPFSGGNRSTQLMFRNIEQQRNEGMVAPTVFAPIARSHMQTSMQLPLGNFQGPAQGLDSLDVPYFRTMVPPASKRKVVEFAGPEKRRRDDLSTPHRKESF